MHPHFHLEAELVTPTTYLEAEVIAPAIYLEAEVDAPTIYMEAEVDASTIYLEAEGVHPPAIRLSCLNSVCRLRLSSLHLLTEVIHPLSVG